jgi:hypothetical protein
MPEVRNFSSRAKDHCEGEGKLGGRGISIPVHGLFFAAAAAGAIMVGAVMSTRSSFEFRLELSTVICSAWSVSRESAAASKLPDAAYAYDSVCGTQVKRA